MTVFFLISNPEKGMAGQTTKLCFNIEQQSCENKSFLPEYKVENFTYILRKI